MVTVEKSNITVRSQTARTERGSTLVLAITFIVPLLFLLLSVVIDIEQLFSYRNSIKSTLDRAATVGAQHLPYAQRAKDAIGRILEQNGIAPSKVQVTTSSSMVSLQYKGTMVPTLARYFGADVTVPFGVASFARVNPRDIVILIDRSSYMAPSLLAYESGTGLVKGVSDDSAIWGNRRDDPSPETNWPAADFFTDLLNPKIKYAGDKVLTRLLTQQCFNFSFGPIKHSAIALYDYFSADSANSVSVLTGPNGIAGVPIFKIHDMQPGGFLKQGKGEGNYPYFRDNLGMAADEYCMAIAENEVSHPGYRVFPRSAALPPLTVPAGKPAKMIDPITWKLDPTRLPFLSARETIWSLSAVHNYSGSTEANSQRRLDMLEGLRAIRRELVGATFRPERYGVTDAVHASAYVLLGDLPWIENRRFAYAASNTAAVKNEWKPKDKKHFVAELENLSKAAKEYNTRLSLYISIMRHPGSYPGCDYKNSEPDHDKERFAHPIHSCGYFFTEVSAFENWIQDQIKKQDRIHIEVLRVPSPAVLTKQLTSLLGMMDKSAIVAR